MEFERSWVEQAQVWWEDVKTRWEAQRLQWQGHTCVYLQESSPLQLGWCRNDVCTHQT